MTSFENISIPCYDENGNKITISIDIINGKIVVNRLTRLNNYD